LPETERKRPATGVLADGGDEVRRADPTADAITKHQRKAKQPEDEHRNAKVDDILRGNVDAVFGARHPGFQAHESGLHQKYEPGADDDPGDV